ncbi:MAG: hypothetical protein Q9184_000284 [Pyrenodesmia sp. 2 TL-2023]
MIRSALCFFLTVFLLLAFQLFSALKRENSDLNGPPPPSKIAAIIETRPLANLIPLISVFASVLGPDWTFRIVHGMDNIELLSKSPLIQRLINSSHLKLIQLPQEVNLTTFTGVNHFYTNPWLWINLAPAEKVLIFQADAMLCANSLRTVDEFVEYDFIGAPLNVTGGLSYNGGLSLRNRGMMLRISSSATHPIGGQFEDQWFVEKMRELPRKPSGEPSANLPDFQVAKQFSTETIWEERPFGVHQITRWHPEKLEDLKAWCPEYAITISGALWPPLQPEAPMLRMPPHLPD